MKLLKQIGKFLGITGKPLEWMPGLVFATYVDPVAVKESVETVIKEKVKRELEAARSAALEQIIRGQVSATSAVGICFEEAFKAIDRIQL